MSSSLAPIPLGDLALIFIPPLLVVGILLRWSLDSRGALYALTRMVVQLLAIGYLLRYLFESDSPGVPLLVIGVMVTAASWIAIRPVLRERRRSFLRVLGAVSLGGLSTLEGCRSSRRQRRKKRKRRVDSAIEPGKPPGFRL